MSAAQSNSARDEVLASIRKNLQASAAHEHHQKHAPAPTPAPEPATDHSSLTDRFIENLQAVRGEWAIVSDIEEASVVLQQIIGEIRPNRIAASDSPLVRKLIDQVTTDAEIIRRAKAAELFTTEVGITSAQLAIAETGTLVLRSESEFSRLTSLVPEVHICILEASQIRAGMSEVLSEIAATLDPAVTFITGPSRTSDIELTLAIGVHGPRELFVILIENA